MDKIYDLEERTAVFGEDIIRFAKLVPLTAVTRPLLNQLIRAGTGIGANYSETDEAESRRDYKHKAAISKKETKETRYWLRMSEAAEPGLDDKIAPLRREAMELNKILGTIVRKVEDTLR